MRLCVRARVYMCVCVCVCVCLCPAALIEKIEESLHTVVAVDTRTFIRYAHRRTEPADVTFNVKDFRAMAALCEHMQRHIGIR